MLKKGSWLVERFVHEMNIMPAGGSQSCFASLLAATPGSSQML